MSEFTSGFLIEAGNESSISKYARSKSVTKKINSKWIAYLTEGDNDAGIIEMSFEFPILFFEHAEDHGWGYHIYRNGNIAASLRIDYEVEEGLLWSLIQERYPEDNPIEVLYSHNDGNLGEELREEVRNNLADLTKRTFDKANFESFSDFGIEDEIIKQLQAYFQPPILTSNNLHESVNVFKQLVMINEMSWVRYDHVVEDGAYDVMFD